MLQGFVHPNFSEVANVLKKQLPKKGPGGASVSIYHQGECVVDIWGGTADEDNTPWQKDTLSLSFSTTKGVASTLLHIAAEQKLIDYEIPVSHYWPEFGQAGKKHITVREALSHQAGLYGIRGMVQHADDMTDWDAMVSSIEKAQPAHIPGTANGYHGLTYGYIVGEVIRRATGMEFSQALYELVAKPLKLDGLYCGLPEEELGRCSKLILPASVTRSNGKGRWRKKAVKHVVSGVLRAAGVDMATTKEGLQPHGIGEFNFNDPKVVQSCMPSANGMFTARSLAKMYAMIANGGEIDGVRLLSQDRIRRMGEIQSKRRDKVVHMPMKWRMGYHRVFTTGPRTPNAFGHFGFGGSGAWCDPSRNLSLSMTLNTGIGTPFGDSRMAYLNSVVLRAADRVIGQRPVLASAY